MRKGLLLLALLFMSGCAHSRTLTVHLRPEVSADLEFFYQNLRPEFVFCAYGKVAKNVISINHLSLPDIKYADRKSVEYNDRTCEAKGLLGVIHSHSSEAYCTFSRTDLVSFAYDSKHPFDFLYCDGQGFAWNDRVQAQKEIQSTRILSVPKGYISMKAEK